MSLDESIAAIPIILETVRALERKVDSLMKLVEGRQPKPQKWLTLKQSAEILNVSIPTVRRYISRGLLRRNAATRHILIPAVDVENFASKVIV